MAFLCHGCHEWTKGRRVYRHKFIDEFKMQGHSDKQAKALGFFEFCWAYVKLCLAKKGYVWVFRLYQLDDIKKALKEQKEKNEEEIMDILMKDSTEGETTH